jgi:hypothetical protein
MAVLPTTGFFIIMFVLISFCILEKGETATGLPSGPFRLGPGGEPAGICGGREIMRSVLLNVAGGLFCAACLLAGPPVAATDLPEDEAVVDPERAGDVVWSRQLGTPYFDQAIGVATDAAGNVLIGGSLGIENRTVGVKYSPAGKRLSTRQLGSLGPWYSIRTMAWDSAGNFLIASKVDGDLYGLEYFVGKYSAAGTRLWTRQQVYGANDVATDAAGNVLIGGQTVNPGECCNSEAFTAKYSPAGKLLWTRTLAGWDYFDTDDMGANAVATDATGNVFIAGSTAKRYEGPAFAFVAKYNPDGKLLWTRKLGAGSWGSAVATDVAGNVLIGGSTGSFGGPRDAFVAKYSPSGKRLWTRQFGTPEEDSRSGVATDAAGNIVIDGMTRGSLGGPNRGDGDVFVLKLRP